MKRIAIIGGGISGLSAAFTLEQRRQQGVPIEYVLFERDTRWGGTLLTERIDDCLVEAGPDSFLTDKPWAIDVCRQLGLADQLIGSNDAGRKTYIYLKGRLVVLPEGLVLMVPTKLLPTFLSPLLSLGSKLRIAGEWLHPPTTIDADETVAAFIQRHYGSEVVDRLADPLLAGIYGGRSDRLSVCAVLPRLREMERCHGSLGRGLWATRRKMVSAQHAPAPLFTSLREGMQQMVEAFLNRLPRRALVTSAPVESICWQGDGWMLRPLRQATRFDALILALPSPAAAGIVQIVSAELARELAAIHYTSSVTVTLGYDQLVRASLPPGFGFLVPQSEGKRMLAATFVHNKFPHRAPSDRALIRCFLGGARDEQILTESEDEILAIVGRELQQTIGLSAKPRFARIYRWERAMAQYEVGHLERLGRIERLRSQLPRLFLAGNAYRGIGVPDCVRSGAEAAINALSNLELESPQFPAVCPSASP